MKKQLFSLLLILICATQLQAQGINANDFLQDAPYGGLAGAIDSLKTVAYHIDNRSDAPQRGQMLESNTLAFDQNGCEIYKRYEIPNQTIVTHTYRNSQSLIDSIRTTSRSLEIYVEPPIHGIKKSLFPHIKQPQDGDTIIINETKLLALSKRSANVEVYKYTSGTSNHPSQNMEDELMGTRIVIEYDDSTKTETKYLRQVWQYKVVVKYDSKGHPIQHTTTLQSSPYSTIFVYQYSDGSHNFLTGYTYNPHCHYIKKEALYPSSKAMLRDYKMDTQNPENWHSRTYCLPIDNKTKFAPFREEVQTIFYRK